MSVKSTMTLMPTEKWYQAPLVDALCGARDGSGVYLVKGPSSAQVERDLPALGKSIEAEGRLLFALHPSATGADGRGAFFGVLEDYVRAVEARQKLTDEARRLFEFLSISYDQPQGGSGEEWSRLSHDAAGRLWTELSRQVPAVLVVLYAHRLIPAERARLEYILRYFYADPIAALQPELVSWEQALGSVVFLDEGFDLGDVVPVGLDLSAPALDSVRSFLANDDIVQRFFDSTGGDLSQLDELVGALPRGVEQFWVHRYDRLSEDNRRVIEILAVAEEGLAADCLHQAVSEFGEARHFARVLKELVAEGFVRRRVGRGTVMLELDNADLGEAIVAQLNESHRQSIHAALAQAELGSRQEGASQAFLARHFLAAGKREEALHHGLVAARYMMQRRAFEPVRELLEKILPVANLPQAIHEIHDHLANVYAQLGNPRQALCHCGHLKRFVKDGKARADLLARSAELLVRLGECESALRLYGQAISTLGEEGADELCIADLSIGQGEALYGLGRQEEARDFADRSFQVLEPLGKARGVDAGRVDEAMIRARNLMGKVAIFKVQYDYATSLFEANHQLATQWGWEKERARAQANIGVVAIQERRYDEAHRRLTDALEISRVPGSLPRAYCLLNLGNVYQRQARYDQALDHFLEALRASRQSG
ncbi:MAG: tetratricopeptide repeat protein, partial [Bradymonadaceae bacterium]